MGRTDDGDDAQFTHRFYRGNGKWGEGRKVEGPKSGGFAKKRKRNWEKEKEMEKEKGIGQGFRLKKILIKGF